MIDLIDLVAINLRRELEACLRARKLARKPPSQTGVEVQSGGCAVIVELLWPPRELSPNARVHHMAKAKVTKAYRMQAHWAILAAKARQQWPLAPSLLSLTFHPPDRRRRDLDGMFASMKAAIDGIADALSVNDHRFEFNLKRADPVKGGSVRVEIT